MNLFARYFNKHNAVWLAIELLFLWIIACPAIAKPWYDSLLFQPWLTVGSADITSIAGISPKILTIPTKSGSTLSAWYFQTAMGKKTVLISHGNAGTIADRKELIDGFLACHVSVLIYDYSGYGISTGKPSLSQILDDGDGVFDCLVNSLKVDPSSIVVVGESLGTGVACHIAAHRACNSLILLSPFCSFMRLAKSKLLWLNLYPPSWIPYVDIDNRTALSGLSTRILIVCGQNDVTISPSESKELAKVCRTCSFVEIPERGHLVYYPPTQQYHEALATFLDGD